MKTHRRKLWSDPALDRLLRTQRTEVEVILRIDIQRALLYQALKKAKVTGPILRGLLCAR